MSLRIGVVIASMSRPDSVLNVAKFLASQTFVPDLVCFSVVKQTDLSGVDFLEFPYKTSFVFGEAGLTAQRNRGVLSIFKSVDIVVFFDDDFVPCENYLAVVADFFDANPDYIGLEGDVIADGAKGPGIDLFEAISLVSSYKDSSNRFLSVNSLYGCNMAYRSSVFNKITFDENLPFYGWLEDKAFSRKALSLGLLAKSERAFGVHQGVKRGRTSGIRFGFSQIVNPIYLYRNGLIGFWEMFGLISRPFSMNLIRSFVPEHYIDRTGRLKGNLYGIMYLLSGRGEPGKVGEFQ